jgi:YHS domain-containing protein/thiol-disulfide isomerase/thioredoxin
MVLRITLATITMCAFVTDVTAGEGWYSSYDEARQVSQRDGVPLLVHFHASYCGPCRQMNSVVFSQPDIQRQLRDGIAAVEIDIDHRRDLTEQFGVQTVPCDFIVMPGQAPQMLNAGFKSAPAYRDLLQGVAARGAQIVKVAPPKITAPEVVDEKPVTQPLVGLDGFCPVELMKNRKWISGTDKFTEAYRGIVYRFSSEEARGEFGREPRKFSPQNLGCDPVTLFADQQAIAGQIKYGAFFDNQLFLFESQENRSTFKENPLKYGRIRHALKVDDLTSRRIQ